MGLQRVVRWLPFLLLGALLIVWLWPLLAGESLFWGLPTLQFYPWRSYAFDELRAGRLPLWNPYSAGGAPLLANYQTAVFYPLNWLHLIIPHVTAMNALAVVHLVVAAIGMWLLGTCWSLPVLGRGVSVLAYAAGGYLVARLGSFPTVAAAAWLPWLFRECHLLVMARSSRNVVRVGLVTAMLLLAGHAQTAFYALAGAGAYVLWLNPGAPRTWRSRFSGWLLAGGGVALGAGLAAIQLVPTAELLSRSARVNGLHYEWVTNFSYSLARALTLLVPNLYGTPANGSYLTEGAYFEDAAYIGLLPFGAALLAIRGWWSMRAKAERPVAVTGVPFWAGMIVVAFLLALGKNSFLFPALYEALPFFRAFQGPVRWLLLLAFGLSMLAGIGVSYAWERTERVVFWNRLALAGGGGMALVAVIAGPRLLTGAGAVGEVMTRAVATFGVLLSGCALLTLARPDVDDDRRHPAWQAAVLVFVAVDLGIAFYGLNPTVPAEFFAPQSDRPLEGEMLYMPEALEQTLTFDRYFSFKDYRLAVARWPELRQSLLPNLNMLDGIVMYNNFEPLDTRAHADGIRSLEDSLEPDADSVIALAPGGVPVSEPFGQTAVRVGGAVTAFSILVSIALTGVERVRSRVSKAFRPPSMPEPAPEHEINVL